MKRKKTINAVITALFLSIFIPSISITVTASQQKMNFFYEFRPEATYKMTAKVESDFTMEFLGEELDEEMMMMSQMRNMKQLVDIDTEQKFGKPDEKGHLPFDVKVVDFKTKMFMGGMEMPLPPETSSRMKDTMMKMQWGGKMTKKGKIVDLFVEGADNMPGFSKEDMKKIFSIFPEFPEKELSVGDDFTYSVTQPFEFGQGKEALKAEIDVTYHYHLKEIREGAAYFDVKTDFQMVAASASSESMKIKGTGKGYGVFDIERHFFMSMNQEGDFTIIADMTSKMKGEKKGSEPVEMIIKVHSKSDMTMTISE